MVKRLVLCIVVVLAVVSSAWAADVNGVYENIAALTDGKPDYSNARFFLSLIHI